MLNAFLFVARKVLELDQTTSEKRMVSGHFLVRVVHYYYLSCSVVEIYPCFKLYFSLFQTHYYPSTYPETKESKIETKDKIKPQHLFTCCFIYLFIYLLLLLLLFLFFSNIIVKCERAERYEYYSCPLLLGQRQDSCLVVTKRIFETQGFFPIGALCFLFPPLCFLSNKQDIFTVLEISFCDLEIEKGKLWSGSVVHVY